MLRAWPPPPTDNEVILYRYWKGGRKSREKSSHPAYKPPLRFVLRLGLQKGVGGLGGGGGGGGGGVGAYLWDTTLIDL